MNFKNFINESENGSYVAAKFTEETNDKLFNWVSSQNLPQRISLIDKNDYHCTILYSKKSLKKIDWINKDISLTASIKGFEIFTYLKTSKCLVLKIKSKELSNIHKYLLDVGGVSDFPNYIPHITVFYDLPDNFDSKQLEIPTFQIKISRIETEKIIKD